MRLHIKDILVAHDVPQLFICLDDDGDKYLCMLYGITPGGEMKVKAKKVSDKLLGQCEKAGVNLWAVFADECPTYSVRMTEEGFNAEPCDVLPDG